MLHTPWLERKFNFDFPVTHLPFILSRLKGTLPRINELIQDLSETELSARPNGKWSIKEHIGHLTDLEALHEGRIDDFKNGLKQLRAADMSNKKTNEAKHNEMAIKDLLSQFKLTREPFISRLNTFTEEELHQKAMHPRLKTEMRPLDMAYFVAEHDDHHLVLMENILS